MHLIVGLGNHGAKYSHNRHNIGFMVAELMAAQQKAVDVSKSSFQGELKKAGELLILKPHTYMNLSGESAQAVAHYYKIEPANIVVVHDEIELGFGAMRFKKGGGHGGHNGLKSLDACISPEYIRVRIGVGRPEHKSEVADYVLQDFSSHEKKLLPDILTHAAEAALALTNLPLSEVCSKYTRSSV